jgi:hypothetical protein
MSNKTIFKRIALVAVTALGAGVLSVAPANADNNSAVGLGNATAAIGVLNVATEPSITGAAVLGSAGALSGSKSLGLLANSTTQDTVSLTSTATMRSDGAIVFAFKGSATAEIGTTVVVDNGTIDAFSATASAATNINAARNQLVVALDATGTILTNFSVKPNAAATSVTVSVYESAALATNNAASNTDAVAVAAIQAGTTSKGTLKQRYTVTVATTSVSGALSAADSFVQGQSCGSLAAPTTNVETSSSHLNITNAASAVACISIDLRDAYNVSLDGKGALIVSGTNGAGIAYETGYSTASTVNNLSDVDTDTSGSITVARPAAFANKNFSTTVTVSWNGAVVATKTVNFLGEVAKLTATVDYIGRAGTSTPAAIGYVVATDSAGNTVYVTSGIQPTATTLNTAVTAISFSDWSDSGTLDTKSDFDATCAGTTATGRSAGSANVTFTYANPLSGSIITSNAVKISCGGDAATYTASFDKAVYAPGDVATLTITGKDAQGALTNAVTDYVGASATLMTISGGGQLTLVGAAPVAGTAEKFSAGAGTMVKRFTVGSTEGAYNAIVSIPVINAYDLGGKDQTVSYKVSGTGAVSNADVLKSIVALIASINKQIQALQKLILKR